MNDDREARRQIREELGRSLVVEASAGSGKTTELVNRLIAVLEAGADVSQIAAVTFTDKAAGELKLRLRSALELRRRDVTGEPLASLERALSRLEEARVSTLHTFAADLLRERPVEAGVDPGFAAEHDARTDLMFDEAFRGWLERRRIEPPFALARVFARTTGKRSNEDQLRQAAMALRSTRFLSAPWERRAFNLRDAIRACIEPLSALARRSEAVNDTRNLLYIDLGSVREAARKLADARLATDAGLAEAEGALVALARAKAFKSTRKGRKDYGPALSRDELLAELEGVRELVRAFDVAASADLACALRAELAAVLREYEEAKRQRGVLDFDDLLERARQLLLSSKEARAVLSSRITHLFVDEFQDTDPVQAAIVLLLASSDPSSADPWTCPLTPGKLFIVGDPKQSIYRFRSADLGTYEVVKKRVLAEGGSLLYLTKSFRSVEGIQTLVNAAFADRMKHDERTLTAEYAPLEKHRTDAPTLGPIVALPAPRAYKGDRLDRETVADSLSHAIGAFVDWLVNESGVEIVDQGRRQPVQARHIALLFKSFSNDRTQPITAALASRAIPHVLVGGRSFYERDEIRSALVALEAIERPDDSLFVVATLRGALFGLRDDAIFEYKLRYGHINPLRPPKTAIPTSLEDVASALAMIARLHRNRNRRPFSETVTDLIASTRAHASLALLPNGEQALANIHRLTQLREESDGVVSFRGCLDLLRARAERGDAGEAPILEEEGDGVRLMTVHKSKGLEFPIVLLADVTTENWRSAPDKHLDVTKNLAAVRLCGCAPWELVEREALEMERNAAEALRVVYVAATRARDMLIVPIVGDESHYPASGWLEPLQSKLTRALRGVAERTGIAAQFGAEITLDRDASLPSTGIEPGFHATPFGRVAVWDPKVLAAAAQPVPAVRDMELIQPDETAAPSKLESEKNAAFWSARAADIGARSAPSVRVKTATQIAHVIEEAATAAAPHTAGPTPPITAPTPPRPPRVIERIHVPRDPKRPGGKRFGTLVHQVLATIELTAEPEGIAKMTAALARLHDAKEHEIHNATVAVVAVTRHPIWQALIEAQERGDLRREVPVDRVVIDDGGGPELIEGVIDVAYRDDAGWVVVDYKTDAPEPGTPRLAAYETQVGLYADMIERAMGEPARAQLLFV